MKYLFGRMTIPALAKVLAILAFALIFTATPQLALGQSADTTPPTLVDFSFTPTTINTDIGDAVVTVTAHVTDSQSGVCDANCTVGVPNLVAVFIQSATNQRHDARLALTSGTINDGIFEAQITLPQFSGGGIFDVQFLIVGDQIGNYRYIYQSELTAQGFPTQLINANTYTGSNVQVTASTPEGTLSNVTLRLAEVTSAGTTSVTTSDSGAALPNGYEAGSAPTYYDLTTTTRYNPPLTPCFTYDSGNYTNPQNLRLLHYANNQWVDVTTSNDTANHVICGQVYSLSPFIVAQRTQAFNFVGFFNPVDNLPTLNTAKAGQTIPVKWALKDANGKFVSDLASIASYGFGSVACSGTTDAVEEYADAGSTGLRYDANASQFILNAATKKTWAGTCKTFILKLTDGTKHQANFKFK